MNFKLTSWLLSFALAVLLFGIISVKGGAWPARGDK